LAASYVQSASEGAGAVAELAAEPERKVAKYQALQTKGVGRNDFIFGTVHRNKVSRVGLSSFNGSDIAVFYENPRRRPRIFRLQGVKN